jgi:N-acetylglucosaminyldiphosphoundecaprenol N-acetyl-beta-D-mannosaminyltransferase
MQKVNILGYPFISANLKDFVSQMLSEPLTTHFQTIAFVNPHTIVEAENDPSTQAILRQFDIVMPDGSGIVLAARILGYSVRERLTGPDFFQQVIQETRTKAKHTKFFFFGATEEVLKLIRDRLAKEAPHIEVVGTLSPPFSNFETWDNSKICRTIREARPDFLWVGMTAPKQEKWIAKNLTSLTSIPKIAAIGAAFDFYAGTAVRSHPWFIRHGLEWLPRLLREPKRLWRRNLISTPIFLSFVAREYLRQTFLKK